MTFISTADRSSNIYGVEYFAHVRELVVVFKGGTLKSYIYEKIEKSEVDALLGASSIGSHFAKTLRKATFRHVKPEDIDTLRRNEAFAIDAGEVEEYKFVEPNTGGDRAQV